MTSDIGICFELSQVLTEFDFINKTKGGLENLTTILLKDIDFIKMVKHNISEVISKYECDPNVDLKTLKRRTKLIINYFWKFLNEKKVYSQFLCLIQEKREGLFEKLEKWNDLFVYKKSVDLDRILTETELIF